MKKAIVTLLTLAMTLSLVACSSSSTTSSESSSNEGASNEGTSSESTSASQLVQYTDLNFFPSVTAQKEGGSSETIDESELSSCRICLIMAATIGSNPAQDFVTQTLLNTYMDNENVTIDVLESLQTSDWEPNLIAAATGDYDLIMGFAGSMKDTIIKVAEQFPDQKFVSIDNTIVGMDNVSSIAGNSNEGSYIVGYCAALLTSYTDIPNINAEKKIAFLGGMDTPYSLDSYLGFAQGAAAADPEVEVMTFYGDSFTDPMGMKEMALAAAEAGCDITYAIAGTGLYGAIEGCIESQTYFFGFDGDYDEQGEGYVISSFVRNLSAPTLQLIQDFRSGNWTSDCVYLATFANGGMGLTDFSVWKDFIGEDLFPQDVVDSLLPYMEGISDGSILVEEYPDFRPYDRATYTILG